jgi:hypothetical protein
MTERLPLLTSSPDAFERALLGSTRGDRPTPDALTRAAAAVGITSGMQAVSSAASAAHLASAAANAVRSAASAAAAGSSAAVLKALVLGVLGGLALTTGASSIFSNQSESRPAEAMVAARPSAQPKTGAPGGTLAPGVPTPLSALVLEEATHHADAAPREIAAGRTPAAHLASKRQSPVASAIGSLRAERPVGSAAAAFALPARESTIADEIAVIDRARLALRQRRPAAALGELAHYGDAYPAGVLTMESVILRVESELALGDRASAERDAARVIHVQPASRYAARLRVLFEPPMHE